MNTHEIKLANITEVEEVEIEEYVLT